MTYKNNNLMSYKILSKCIIFKNGLSLKKCSLKVFSTKGILGK